MTRFLSAFGKAVSFTVRGAAVTFGSTVFSCVAACSIEKSANRMILKCYPHKFVNVEAASGITQEELDFVKHIYGGSMIIAAGEKMAESSFSTRSSRDREDNKIVLRYESQNHSKENQSRRPNSNRKTRTINATEQYKTAEKEVNKFWTEGEEAATKALSMIPTIVPRQEILACSMTA
mmetsp:Transcript_13223/g.31088  ORF Transcript_13223/g.31088 Transcript_13223/m.31088 type:complete len:178 (-) Transcript_13223:284-817(-)